MTITTEAIYENGVLKLSVPLPFQEHQKVELVINAEPSWAERTAGILRWNGEAEDLRQIAEDDEFGLFGDAMILDEIPQGTSVFVDANTLIYHFAADPQYGTACTNFVRRVERREIVAMCSTHVVSDIAHRLMTIDAILAFGWPIAGIAQRLRRNHAEIPRLTRFRQVVEQLPQSNLQVLPVVWPQVSAAVAISQRYQLLCGDALIVAIMEHHGLTHLASNDADFDRVPWLKRYSPV